MKSKILPSDCIKWLKKCFLDFENDGCGVEIVLALKIKEENIVIAVFNSKNYLDSDTSFELMSNLKSSFLNIYQTEKKDWNFYLRFFDRNVFLSGITRFDPDIVRLITDESDVIIGKDKYNAIRNNFISENSNPPREYVFLPYLEDTLFSWEVARDRLIRLDTQLSRCFFNGIKLFYTITVEQKEITVDAISTLVDINVLCDLYSSMDFIKPKESKGFSKEELGKLMFEKASEDINVKLLFIEEFIVQLTEYIFEWIENNGNNYSCNMILNWLIILNKSFNESSSSKRYKEFTFSFLKTLELSTEKGSEDHNNIILTGRNLGLYGY